MNCIIIYYVLLFIASCTQDVFCKHNDVQVQTTDNGDKIVGGSDAEITDYPYQAYLQLFNGSDYFQCGGTIVNNRTIATAAHCLTGIQSIQVRIGSTYSNRGGLTYDTSTFYQHPFYNPTTFEYDVGVVKVNEGMTLDGVNAATIKIADFDNDPEQGDNVVITGWGATEQGGDVTDTLQEATVIVVNRTYCTERISSVTDRKFCANRPEGGVDTCQGDSGGPAVINNTLAGITSYGIGCAQQGYPGVYARVGEPVIWFFIWALTLF